MVLMLVGASRIVSQSNISAGELHGRVFDPSGALVPAAIVSARDVSTGVERFVLTDGAGEYRLLALIPGEYEIRIHRPGFRTAVVKNVAITVGQIAPLDTSLELGVETEVLEVSGSTPLVETERTSQSSTIEARAIHSLPIDRRDYLTFALLTPMVADSTALADNADYRIKQTPSSGLSFIGLNGRGNSVSLDGGEANDAGGGVRSTVSQEAVQEFQVNRSNYSAELGGASGGIINIISKPGSNEIRGSLFSFFRHQALDAGDPFARVLENGGIERTKPPSQRQQFGASLGMPVKRQQTFLFGAFEGLLRDESAVVSLLTDPSIFDLSPEQQAIVSALPAEAAALLERALETPQSTVDLFTRNSGVFPFSTTSWMGSLRLDHRLPSDQFLIRFNQADLEETNANVQALVGASRGTEVKLIDPTLLLGWTRTANSRFINEARVQANYRKFSVASLEKFGPELRIHGYGVFNRDFALPSRNVERRYEIRDTVTHGRGAHLLKFGAQLLVRNVYSESHVFFPGRFTFGDLPARVLNPALPPELSISALQAFNLGLAQTFQQGFGNGSVRTTRPWYAVFAQDSWKVGSNMTIDAGIRYELDTRKPPLPTDKNNIAPRLGFAWDPFSDRKTTVRAGYGIFYSPTYFQLDYIVNALNVIDGRRQIAQVFSSIQTPGPAAAHNIFTTLRMQGVIQVPTPVRMITAADLTQFGVSAEHTGPIPPFTVIFENSPDFVNPYSQHASLTIERRVFGDTSISAGYTYARTLHLPRSRDANLLPAPVDERLGIRVWSNPVRDFVNPAIAQLNVYESAARASYSGLFIELRRRFSRSLLLNANYTFSRAWDEVTDYNVEYQANDQTNLRAERALSAFDQRHKIMAYAVWLAPWQLELAPVFRSNSGRPFNLLVGSDLNLDRHDTTDRPPFAGRNTGIGPAFWTLDLRVARDVRLTERWTAQLMVESFNIFNKLNFATLNNTVGVIPGPFNLSGRHDRTPSEPLGFTSAYDSRRIQAGVRLRF
jgi:hypothetical protein